MAKKNRYVADIPGETAEDRLQHYVQQAQSLPDRKVEASASRHDGGDGDEQGAHQRSFISKLFGISIAGWVQLVLVCVAVGAISEASGINPFSPNFSLNGAATAAMTGALNVLGWAMQAGWRPLVTGAVIVLPVWLVWRLASAGFRR